MLGNTLFVSDNHFVYIFGKIYNNDSNNTYIPRLIKGLNDIKRIDCGFDHVLCLDFNGSVFSFGKNDYGQLGLGKNNNDSNNTYIPRLIKGLYDIKRIDCGSDHVLCLDFNGSVFSFGKNDYGQLGLGKNNNELKETYIPQKIDIPPCKQVACGDHFSVCLVEDGLLYYFGNIMGEKLGLYNNNNNNNYSPRLIPNLHNIEYIVCGGYHIICKTYNNVYYGWGSNYYGQLGHVEYKTYNKPTQCNNYPDNIISIKCGNLHTLLLTLEGNIYSFGNNFYEQLGLNSNDIRETNIPTLITNISEIKRIECGYRHSMCIDVNSNLWLFGANEVGQLGLGDKENRSKPTKHPTLSNIMDISSRGDSTFIKTLDRKIYAFGNNDYSQLGIKINEYCQLTPIQVFQDNEDIWGSFIGKSKQKSARK